MTRRDRSKEHEVTWLSLVGFCLRPGIGVELDAQRIERLWRVFNLGLSYPKERACQVQWALMWRRVSLGLDSLKQQAIFNALRPKKPGEAQSLLADPERLMLLASLERLRPEEKAPLARSLVQAGQRAKGGWSNAIVWSLARLLNRYPLSGSVDCLISVNETEELVRELLQCLIQQAAEPTLSAALLWAGRKTEDPLLCVPDSLRLEIASTLRRKGIKQVKIDSLENTAKLSELEWGEVYGEQLPAGLRVRSV